VTNRELFAGRWAHITGLVDAVSQPGLHVVIYGERGVGKTSLANIIPTLFEVLDDDMSVRDEATTGTDPRLVVMTTSNSTDTFQTIWCRALDELTGTTDNTGFALFKKFSGKRKLFRDVNGISDTPSIDEIRHALELLPRSVFVFDEFDILPTSAAAGFTGLIKTMSDRAVDSTLVIVGVSSTIDGLVSKYASIERAIKQIELPRMTQVELSDIIGNAENKLAVSFDEEAKNRIVRLSQGLPHYTHLLGLHSLRAALKRYDRNVTIDDVSAGCKSATGEAEHTISSAYEKATYSSHKEALFRQILLACAIASLRSHDADGYFQALDVLEPLRKILPNKIVEISTFNSHLSKFGEAKRGSALERSGISRLYKYRFKNPLLAPYAILQGLSSGIVSDAMIDSLTNA
jgi:Cdc6-like AAA superfamily ATPase